MMEECIIVHYGILHISKEGIIMRFKIYIIPIMIILFSIFNNYKIYAEKLDYLEMSFYGWYISVEDIYALREEYQKKPDLEKKNAMDFLMNRAQNYKKDIDCVNTNSGYINVLTYEKDIGYQNYYISDIIISSSYLGSGPIYLYSAISNNYIALDVSKEELDKFLEYNDKLAEKYRSVCEYVRNYLKEDEYIEVYVNEGIPYVGLSDETKSAVIEKEGIAWEFSEKSREDKYQQLQYLWKNREELQIVEVFDNFTISIYGLQDEEDFKQKVAGEKMEDCYYEKDFRKQGIDERLTKIKEWHELTKLSNFILIKKNDERYVDWGEKFWKELEVWLEYMKKLYPEYSYENLFHMAYVSRDKNYYTDFDTELEKFAETLPYIKNQKNPFDENEFGDSEHLVLKALLKNCKDLYPEKEYAQLYDSYAKEVNESGLYTAEEKRNRFVWKLLQVEKELEELQKLDNNEILAYFGFGVLIVACGIFAIYKNKKL